LFREFQAAGTADVMPIFILGMLRSGTTLVEQILASHSKVHGAGELRFLNRIVTSRFRGLDEPRFTESIQQANIDDFTNAGDEYIGTIRKNADSVAFITDKMPYNFRLIGMIKLMMSNAKIIHCCRAARDTFLSIFKNEFADDGNYYANDLGELGRYHNLYRDLMTHWHSVLPDFIYDIQYEDMVADQEAQSKALLAFCGLEWDDACLAFHRTNRPVQTASAAQVRRPIFKDSVRAWMHYENQLVPLLEILAER
jgi:Sulfotransferase family